MYLSCLWANTVLQDPASGRSSKFTGLPYKNVHPRVLDMLEVLCIPIPESLVSFPTSIQFVLFAQLCN